MNKSKLTKLNELIKVCNGYAFESNKFSYIGNPIIKIKNVSVSRTVDTVNCDFYPDEYCTGLDKYILNNNDILISMTGSQGSIGKVSRFKNNSSQVYYLNQRVGRIEILDDNILNAEYLFQVLSLKHYENRFFKVADGSGQPNLSPQAIGLLEIPLPDLLTQKKIADLLSSLDDKIEINNKINQELEELGQALYTKWFVNFDFPNEEGKPYKSSGGEMIESELGMIPKGWRVDNLDSIAIKNKKAFKDKAEWCNLSLMDLSNMPSRNCCLSSWDNGFKMNTNGYELNEYDILFGSIRPYLKKAGFSPIKGVVAGTVHSFSPVEDIYYSYILNTVITDNMFEYAVSRSTGTRMPTISYDNLMNYPISIPESKDIMRDFNKMTYPFIEQMKFNILQNKKLEELRDFLIPQLMSGNLEIKDIDNTEKEV